MNDRLEVTFDVSDPGISLVIERLATNDEFRAQLAENPKAALAEYGIEVPTSLVPTEIELPSKADVEQIRELLAGPSEGKPEVPCLWIGLAILSRALTQRSGADAA